MNKITLVIIGSLAMAATAKADVALNIEYEFPVSSLKSVADALDRVGDGPYIERVQSGINVGCPAGKPDTGGNGCQVLFSSESGSQPGIIGLKIIKQVSKDTALAVYRQALELTTTSDPNTAGGDAQFGNPLTGADAAERSHYYCAPRGDTGSKVWKCYLSVSETLGQTPGR